MTSRVDITETLRQAREINAKAEKPEAIPSTKPDTGNSVSDTAPRDVLLKKMPGGLLDKLEVERAKRGLRSRDATIRALLDEALA